MPELLVNLNPQIHLRDGSEVSILVSDSGAAILSALEDDVAVTVHDQDLELFVTGGATGPAGPPGPSGGGSFVHDQSLPSASWTITHNLGFFPNITVIDSGGSQCFGTVAYTSVNVLQITFSAGFAGKAYLS